MENRVGRSVGISGTTYERTVLNIFLNHTRRDRCLLVPPAGIEPALLSEPDFESGASTNSAKGAARASDMGEPTTVKSQIHAEPPFGQQQ